MIPKIKSGRFQLFRNIRDAVLHNRNHNFLPFTYNVVKCLKEYPEGSYMVDEKKYKESIDKKMTTPAAPVVQQPQPAPQMPEMPQMQMPEMPQMQMPQMQMPQIQMPQIQMPEMPQIQMPQCQSPIMMPQFQAPAMMPQTPPVCCPFLMNMQCPMQQAQQMMPAAGSMANPYMSYRNYTNPYDTYQYTTYNPMGTMQY
jgi:hypothetical protein